MNLFVRRLLGLTIALAAIGTIIAFAFAPGARAAAGDFVITTRGWGHGAGMSQWGAWEAAREGKKYDYILAFYYPGTKLTKYDTATNINVRLTRSGATSFYRLDLSAMATPAKLVMHGSTGDQTRAVPVGTSVRTLCVGTKVQVSGTTGAFDWVEMRPDSTEGRVGTTMYTSATSVAFANQYWGSIRVQPNSATSLQVHNTVPLDKYVGGVSEIDPGWAGSDPRQAAPEAVKAQATAARTYAVARGGAELYDDVRDQVYGGYNYELRCPGVPVAAAATAGTVITYGGKPIIAYFHSSSGGYLSTSAWSDTASVPPYIVVKPDPWSLKAPVSPWTIKPGYTVTCTFSPAVLASKLGTNVGTITKVEVIARDSSDPGSHARTVKITGTGGSTTMAARTFKSRLSLKSTLIVSITGGGTVTPGTKRYEQGDTHLDWTGTWETFAATGTSGGTYKRAKTLGSSCTVTFTGTYLAWIANKGTTVSKAWVSLDGGSPKLVDLAAVTVARQVNVWNTGTLKSAPHKVKIWWYEKNVAGKYISVDAFDIKGTIQ